MINRNSIAAAVRLVLLCVLLLTAVIVAYCVSTSIQTTHKRQKTNLYSNHMMGIK